MSKERKPRLAQRLQTDRGLYRALQRWGYYLLALMAWVTVVLAVSALGVLVCSRLTWYETDPLYHLLLWVRDYYFFFCIAVVLLGWVVISWHFISRPVRQLDALIGASAPAEVQEYDFRGLQISRATHKCVLFGEELPLTPLEFSILWYLCQHRGQVVSSEELFESVWGEKYMDSNNTVMSHIARLREKMHEPSRRPRFIKTVWGVGYTIE